MADYSDLLLLSFLIMYILMAVAHGRRACQQRLEHVYFPIRVQLLLRLSWGPCTWPLPQNSDLSFRSVSVRCTEELL